MATSKRLTRHEIKEPDQILSTFDHAARYAASHPKQVILAVVAVFGVAALIAGASGWVRARDRAANAALAALLETAGRPLATDTAAGETDLVPFPDAATRERTVIEEAQELLANHDRQSTNRATRMILASALARSGQYAEAAEAYRSVAGSAPQDTLGASAALAAATTQAAAGDSAAAIAELKRLASGQNPYLPGDLVLDHAAAIAERAGLDDEALTLYQRVQDEGRDEGLKAQAKRKATALTERRAAAAEAAAP